MNEVLKAMEERWNTHAASYDARHNGNAGEEEVERWKPFFSTSSLWGTRASSGMSSKAEKKRPATDGGIDMATGFLDTTDLMAHGHEGWLEPSTTHVHEGDDMRIYFKWGHNMKSDGLARKEGLSAFVALPHGEQRELPVSGQEEDCYVFDFVPETAGVYHFVCVNRGYYVINREGKHLQGTLKDHPDAQKATCYKQLAHLSMQVGHNIPEDAVPRMPELDLRLVPGEWKKWRTGDEMIFNLQHRLQTVPDRDIILAHAAENGGEVRYHRLKTDGEGLLNVKIEEPGRYLAVARHRTEESEPGLYHDSSLTYTFFFSIRK